MSLHNSVRAEGFFDTVFEDRPLKYVGLFFSFAILLILSCLTAGVIWFELYGSDLKRIFTNRIVSSVCWAILEGYLFIVLSDYFLCFFGPFPSWVCHIQIILRQALVLRIPLLLDAIIVARCAFIFWLKNPLRFEDGFWCTFANIWIPLFSVISQAVYIWMPGRQPLQFYLCSNRLSEDIESMPRKQNWIALTLLLSSFILYIVANFMIKYFTMKQKQAVMPLVHNPFNQLGNIAFVGELSLTDCITSICTIVTTSVFLGTLYGLNASNPKTFAQGENYLFVYYLLFAFPLLVTAPIILSFYAQNGEMRRALRRECQSQVSQILEILFAKLAHSKTSFRGFFDATPQLNDLQL